MKRKRQINKGTQNLMNNQVVSALVFWFLVYFWLLYPRHGTEEADNLETLTVQTKQVPTKVFSL